MLTLVAAVEVYERAAEGREMVDWVSLVRGNGVKLAGYAEDGFKDLKR
jgi:hypothetical protein